MLTGYNTDFLHRGVVLHVQTEDKGEDNPFIESLIYIGGRVVAVERSSYQDLVDAGAEVSEVEGRMDAQHTALIEAVRRGEYDRKLKDYLPTEDPTAVPETPDEGTTLTPEALGELVDGYLHNEVAREVLELTLDGELTVVQQQATTARIRLRGSSSGRPLDGVSVWAELISTLAEPQVLAQARSDAEGRATLQFEVPALEGGTGALIIAAESEELGRAEVQHLL
jgi:hypothetical protein